MSALGLVVEQGPRGAHNGLHASLAGGTLHPPAPAVCLLDGLPPRHLRRQGRFASLRDGLRPVLTAPVSSRPGDTGRPGRARSNARPAGRDPRGGDHMTNQQLAEAIRELQGIVVVQRGDLEALRNRVEELERAEEQRYQTDQEFSAHLNGMTYP
jgi:hypothetical protein